MAGSAPLVGSKAPPFTLTSHDCSAVSLDGFLGKKHVVLYFFPKADTPG